MSVSGFHTTLPPSPHIHEVTTYNTTLLAACDTSGQGVVQCGLILTLIPVERITKTAQWFSTVSKMTPSHTMSHYFGDLQL